MLANSRFANFDVLQAAHSSQVVNNIHFWPVSLPLKRSINHASAQKAEIESVIIQIEFEDATGFAEVRGNGSYATHEDTEDILVSLENLNQRIIRGNLRSGPSLGEIVSELEGKSRLATMLFDVAGWDALAKQKQLPLSDLIAGKTMRRVIETHAQIPFLTVEETYDLAKEFFLQGFQSVKIRIGSSNPLQDVERVRATREAIGPEVEILSDANGGWTVEQTFQVLEPLAELSVAWLEQPTRSVNELTQITQRAEGIKIRADESVRDANDIWILAEQNAVHGVHLKLEKAGTLVNLIHTVDAAADCGLDVAFGQMDQGILGCAATCHLASGLAVHEAEVYGYADISHDVTSGLVMKGGNVILPEASGLGVEPELSHILERQINDREHAELK